MAEQIFQEGTDFRALITNEQGAGSVEGSLRILQEVCHGLAVQGGWWDKKPTQVAALKALEENPDLPDDVVTALTAHATQERNPLELLMLSVTEISEAVEGVRKNQMDDHLPHRKMEEVEVADAIVRLLDYAGGRGLDVAGALVEKLAYNITRADHQPENRAKPDGKKC